MGELALIGRVSTRLGFLTHCPAMIRSDSFHDLRKSNAESSTWSQVCVRVGPKQSQLYIEVTVFSRPTQETPHYNL